MMDAKTCCSCGECKPLAEFSKDKTKKDGHHTKCKACVRAYKADHADAISVRRREYRQAHRDEIAAYMKDYRKDYRAKNREVLSTKSSQWNRANAERFAQIRRESRRRNMDASRSITRNRRAKIKMVGGKHTAEDVRQLGELQRWKCACCRVDVSSGYHVDHIIPIAAGGSNDKTNLQLLCAPCNQSKSARHPVEFMQSRGFLC